LLREKLSIDLTSPNYESERLTATIRRPVVTTRCVSISRPPELSPCEERPTPVVGQSYL
jgi:hypothetical protein